ncbi:MAG: FecR domain-containing protein [Bacteroidales bacterium]|nr:FecR domain-containing protein [Bacteroidales bacterium]
MDIDINTLQDYLDGKLSDEENLEVQVYLSDHMDDPEVQSLLEGAFDSFRIEKEEDTFRSLTATRARLGIAPRRALRPFIRLAAAAVTLLLAVPAALQVGYHLHKEPAPVAWMELSVPTAQTRELTLPDGTHLSLGAESRVTWPESFTGEERRIFLDGEVTAKVAKDPEHPFIIQSGDIDVRVHGTTFNFKSYRNNTLVEMMLLEGSVSMDIHSEEGTREVRLTPGDIAQYNRQDGDVVLGKFSPESFRVFSDERSFSFFNIPLSDIAADLERAFGTKIVVADQSIVSHRFLAFFTNHESLDEILRLLSANGDLRVVRSDGVVYLYGK